MASQDLAKPSQTIRNAQFNVKQLKQLDSLKTTIGQLILGFLYECNYCVAHLYHLSRFLAAKFLQCAVLHKEELAVKVFSFHWKHILISYTRVNKRITGHHLNVEQQL